MYHDFLRLCDEKIRFILCNNYYRLMTSKEKVSIEDLVSKAKKVGFDKVPESTSELEIKLVEIMRQSGKIFTAKQMCKDILNEQDPKWFSDKMWNLAKKGVLKKLPTRGFYQYNFDRESQ